MYCLCWRCILQSPDIFCGNLFPDIIYLNAVPCKVKHCTKNCSISEITHVTWHLQKFLKNPAATGKLFRVFPAVLFPFPVWKTECVAIVKGFIEAACWWTFMCRQFDVIRNKVNLANRLDLSLWLARDKSERRVCSHFAVLECAVFAFHVW